MERCEENQDTEIKGIGLNIDQLPQLQYNKRDLIKNEKDGGKTMQESTRQEKIEAIVGICQYDRKLIDALEDLADDLESGKETLPSELLGTVMQGINWTVGVLNQTMDVFNEGEEKLEKQMINDALVAFNEAYSCDDAGKIAAAIKNSLLPCLERICEIGENFK